MIDDIERIIKIFEGAKITKLDLELKDLKLKLEKPEFNNSISKNNIIDNRDTPNEAVVLENYNTFINAPVVGTFYSSKSEGAEPFVKIGQKVKRGDVLCIIEAMKVLNEITSDRDGIIVNILVNNEDFVMFDQKLFEIGDIND